jgi:hypothetical protein
MTDAPSTYWGNPDRFDSSPTWGGSGGGTDIGSGVTISGTPGPNKILVATSSSAAQWISTIDGGASV